MKNISRILALIAVAVLLSACDGDGQVACRDEVNLRILGADLVQVANEEMALAQVSERLKAYSESCGGKLIVVIGSDEGVSRETIVKVFALVRNDPSVLDLGISKT
jgi:biopolymer transport protein ExbD